MQRYFHEIKNLSDGEAKEILANIYADYLKRGRNNYGDEEFIKDLEAHFRDGLIGKSIFPETAR